MRTVSVDERFHGDLESSLHLPPSCHGSDQVTQSLSQQAYLRAVIMPVP